MILYLHTYSLTDAMKSMDSEEFLHFISRYKFTLSFENAVCEDYITEKSVHGMPKEMFTSKTSYQE